MSNIPSSSSPLINLLGYTLPQLEELVQGWGHKKFRAKQLFRWIHQQQAHDFTEMSDLAKDFRQELSEKCVLPLPTVLADQTAQDGTRKWLLDVGNQNAIEMVFIPEDDRGTLCVSTQAGCNVGCPFCSTGYQGFSRNLTAAEIVMQLWWANKLLKEDGTGLLQREHTENARIISNVVFMGMGEPLLNYSATLQALRIFLDDHAYGLSRRRVTVSTSGVLPFIEQLGQDCPVALAVSLHAPNDRLRDQLVPLNKKYPISELLSVCRAYLSVAPRDFITFEYIMLDGVNDTLECAQELAEIASQISCKINLIPFNPYPQSGLKRSTPAQVKRFAQFLMQAGVVTTVRKTRGEDIDAACGQLAGEVVDRTQSKMREKSVQFFIDSKEGHK